MLGRRLLCTISKRPEGIRLLRVGTSIHLFIVSGKRAAGAIFLKEFCISPVSPVTRNRPFPKSLYIPAFLFSFLSFDLFTGFGNWLYIFVEPKSSSIDLPHV